jgi:hypothetical protein
MRIVVSMSVTCSRLAALAASRCCLRVPEGDSVLLAEDADPLLPRVRGLTGSAEASARPV